MARNNSPQDEKLIQDLYEKLNWFTFQATDEEFDAEQVRSILKLLDSLDPLPDVKAMLEGENAAEDDSTSSKESDRPSGTVSASDPAAAFERFKKKYNITEEELAGKSGRNTESSGSAAEEKIISFRPGNGDSSKFSEELAFNGSQVREKLSQAGVVSVDASGEAFAGDISGKPLAGMKKPAKHRRSIISSAWGKAAVAIIIVLVMGTGLTIGTSAVQQKPFLEVLENGVNRMRIIVTGNEMEGEEESGVFEYQNTGKVYYSSWEEIQEEYNDILIPNYIPDGLQLEELYQIDSINYELIIANYYDRNCNDNLIFYIKRYKEEYADIEIKIHKNWKEIARGNERERKNIVYYQLDERYKVLWVQGRCIYDIEDNDLLELEKIVSQMGK